MGVRKFQESQEVLNYLKEYGTDKEVMVPLTSSLYVPGVMEETDKVLVEVGASYFIEQKNQAAVDYCSRKKALLEGNAKKINEISVPKAFYKVAYSFKYHRYIGFIIPNEPVRAKEVWGFAMPISKIEKELGMKFFSNINDGDKKDLNLL